MSPVARSSESRSPSVMDLTQGEASSFLSALDRFFGEQVAHFEEELREPVRYALTHSGKRLRPLLVCFSSGTARDQHPLELVRAAAVVEFVHLATLVHDDILDEAEIRHRSQTVSQRYGVNAAVLLGDALFAQALQLASEFPTTEVCRLVSRATRRVCAGEIEQTLQRGEWNFDVDRYFRIIERKTAELFDVSCRLGMLIGAGDPNLVTAAGEFGRRLGRAYQIFDDLVDLVGDEESSGKTLGTDFASGKSTLPLLLLFEGLNEPDRRLLVQSFAEGKNSGGGRFEELFAAHNVIPEVEKYFNREIAAAEQELLIIEPAVPASATRLRAVAAFVRERFDGAMAGRRAVAS